MAKLTIYSGRCCSGRTASFDSEGRYAFTDTIGSVMLQPGWSVMIYKQNGDFIRLDESEQDLTQSGWSDRIAEIALVPYRTPYDAAGGEDIWSYNYVVGTQNFAPAYGFSGQDATFEAARRMYEMGANTIKLFSDDRHRETFHKILESFPFRYVLTWYHSSGAVWQDGFDDRDRELEYSGMYNFASELLRRYDGSGITFYIGNWEGDWLLTGTDATVERVAPERLDGMAKWYSTRQRAIDDAKRDTPHNNVRIYNYAECNRSTDIDRGFDRMANRVLPCTDVDLISYSAYDVQNLEVSEIDRLLRLAEDTLKPRDTSDPVFAGRRIFAGETSWPWELTHTEQEHNRVNTSYMIKYLKLRLPFALFWEMYNNEVTPDGRQRGFWLIDSNNHKWRLWYTIKSLYDNGREIVRNYKAVHGTLPPHEVWCDFAIDFLGRRI